MELTVGFCSLFRVIVKKRMNYTESNRLSSEPHTEISRTATEQIFKISEAPDTKQIFK